MNICLKTAAVFGLVMTSIGAHASRTAELQVPLEITGLHEAVDMVRVTCFVKLGPGSGPSGETSVAFKVDKSTGRPVESVAKLHLKWTDRAGIKPTYFCYTHLLSPGRIGPPRAVSEGGVLDTAPGSPLRATVEGAIPDPAPEVKERR